MREGGSRTSWGSTARSMHETSVKSGRGDLGVPDRVFPGTASPLPYSLRTPLAAGLRTRLAFHRDNRLLEMLIDRSRRICTRRKPRE